MNLIHSIFQIINNRAHGISNRQIGLLAIILGIPAYLLNLGNLPIIGDEGIRNLVALEMKLSGNFIVPTLNGELYLNKPPLFNWLIYLNTLVMGHGGEMPSRLVNLFFLGIFAATVFYWTGRYAHGFRGITLVLMFLTSGRILFWDSMYGLIDICFSWVIFLNFMWLYHFGNKGKWLHFFLLSYLLCSVAFMLKGLPALVFQAISIIVALAFFGEFKRKFFTWIHIGCAVIGLLPVVTYYLVYMAYVPLDQVFSVLADQSLRRTATHHGIFKTIVHFFTFPFEQLYHFLPWSLFVVFIFTKKFWSWISGHHFVKYNWIMLAANIPVYWLSVEVYPRYLLMFIPLFNLWVIHFYQNQVQDEQFLPAIFQKFFISIAALLTCVSFGLPLFESANEIPQMTTVWLGSALLLTLFCLVLWKAKENWILWLAIFMLAVRIVFNLTVLEVRPVREKAYTCKIDAERVMRQYKMFVWYIYGDTELHQISRYYLTQNYQQIITQQLHATDTTAIYIVDPEIYPEFSGVKIDSVFIETGRYLNVMKLTNKSW